MTSVNPFLSMVLIYSNRKQFTYKKMIPAKGTGQCCVNSFGNSSNIEDVKIVTTSIHTALNSYENIVTNSFHSHQDPDIRCWYDVHLLNWGSGHQNSCYLSSSRMGQVRAGPGILFRSLPLRAGSPLSSDPHSWEAPAGSRNGGCWGWSWGCSTLSPLPAGPQASHQSEHAGGDATSFWNAAAALPLALSLLSLTQITTNAARAQVSAPHPGAGAPCSAHGPLFLWSVPWLWVASFFLLPQHSVQRQTVIFVQLLSPWIGCEHFVRDKFS